MRPFQQLMRKHGLQRSGRELAVRVPDFMRGVLFGQEPTVVLYTDASTAEWGAHWGHHRVAGIWSRNERGLHINVLEMRAVVHAICVGKALFFRQRVLVMTDNTTVMAYIITRGDLGRPLCFTRPRHCCGYVLQRS